MMVNALRSRSAHISIHQRRCGDLQTALFGAETDGNASAPHVFSLQTRETEIKDKEGGKLEARYDIMNALICQIKTIFK